MVPFISVIIPVFNKGASIQNTLKSVLKQEMSDFEIVIVNDGSTDDSLSKISTINDSRIKIYSTINKGVSSARNWGVKMANAQYVAFLDADDYWYPNHLEVVSHLISKFPDHKWFATAYEIQHNRRMCLSMSSPLMNKKDNWVGEVDDYFLNSLRDNLAWTSAVCMRVDFFDSLGGFDLSLRNNQDTDLWLRSALVSPLVFTPMITARYILDGIGHISKRNIMKKTVMDFDKYEQQCSIHPSLRKYLDLNRYSVALRYKLVGEPDLSQEYYKMIQISNLTKRQILILNLPKFLLKRVMHLKSLFERLNVRMRSN